MKYLTEERFIVQSSGKEAIKNYADNYDRIFGEAPKPCPLCGATDHEHIEAFGTTVQGCPAVPDNHAVMVDTDAIECRLTSWANIAPASPEAVISDVDGPACPGCGVVMMIDRPLCCEDCYRHDPACAKLCTEGAECDCGIGD